MPHDAAVDFVRVRRDPTLSEKVAKSLTSYIFTKNLRPGDRLPSERELGEVFNVSRTVIREAVRSLVGKGLLRSQSGSRLTVADIGAAEVGDLLDLVVRGRAGGDHDISTDTLLQLHEVRSTLEVQIAGLAAARATKAEIEQLRSFARQLACAEDDETRSAADVAFHRALATATHNEFYVIMLDALVGPLMHLRRATLRLKTGAPDAVAGHAKILDAVEDGDAEAARAAMAVHIAESGRALKKMRSEQRGGDE